MDPFSHLRAPSGGGGSPSSHPFPHHLDNNNFLEAAEKARIMMLYRHQLVFQPPGGGGGPGLPPPPPRPNAAGLPPVSLPADFLARYSSAVQATLGLYNPSLLAAALRNSAAAGGGGGGPSGPLLLPPPPHLLSGGLQPPQHSLQPKMGAEGNNRSSPPVGLKSPRFSPYVLPQPMPRRADSPLHQSAASDDGRGEGQSPSPRSSPPAASLPTSPSLQRPLIPTTTVRPAFPLFR